MGTPLAVSAPVYEVRFNSLFVAGRALAFPCNAAGQVDLDALTERQRNNFSFARVMVGRDFAHPCVGQPVASA